MSGRKGSWPKGDSEDKDRKARASLGEKFAAHFTLEEQGQIAIIKLIENLRVFEAMAGYSETENNTIETRRTSRKNADEYKVTLERAGIQTTMIMNPFQKNAVALAINPGSLLSYAEHVSSELPKKIDEFLRDIDPGERAQTHILTTHAKTIDEYTARFVEKFIAHAARMKMKVVPPSTDPDGPNDRSGRKDHPNIGQHEPGGRN